MAHKKIICFDFDGVIHSYESGWQGAENIPDSPVQGAIAFLQRITHHPYSEIYDVHIYSARSGQAGGIPAMKEWLLKWARRVYPALNPQNLVERITFPRSKPPAFVTIDDRVIAFDGNYKLLMQAIEDFKPWNKKDV